jgi:hypothetical protein
LIYQKYEKNVGTQTQINLVDANVQATKDLVDVGVQTVNNLIAGKTLD